MSDLVLVTNDDGFDAPGLQALVSLLEEYFVVVVVAPEENQSYIGHSVTVGPDLTVTERGPNFFSLAGRPADCVRVGLNLFAREARWVFSGVNHGANLGADVFSSGTVAAVREGVLAGIPGVAISHYRRGGSAIEWQVAHDRLKAVIEYVISSKVEPGEYLNFNLPHPADCSESLPEIRECRLDLSPHDIAFDFEGGIVRWRGVFQNRRRVAGGDVSLCIDEEFITVSRLKLSMS